MTASILRESNVSWIFRYKLHHVLFWFIYHTMFWFLLTGSLTTIFHSLLYTPYVIKFSFYVIFQAAGVYFNLYFLIPRFLEKGRYVMYVLLLAFTVATVSAVVVMGYYTTVWVSGKSFLELFKVENDIFLHFFKVNALPSTLAAMTMGMSLKLAKNWVQSKRRQQLLETEKLETELKFLRSQVNPHFLFNTINSIFVLIHKNPSMASESLAKFSDLLRYQLYECNEPEILLSQELSYLKNFIELEKLRQDSQLEIQMEENGPHSGMLMIAPFILLPFIENAFKHVSRHKTDRNWILIQIETEGKVLRLHVVNGVAPFESSAHMIQSGGIGLKNVQRRLDLIYPEKHRLQVIDNGNQFEIDLTLHLQDEKSVLQRADKTELINDYA